MQRNAIARRHVTMPPGIAFWLVALAFVVMMAFVTIPSPLYPLYQDRDHFPTVVVTVIFGIYAIGVIIALNLGGHVSDWVGRRKVLVAAAAIETVAAILFVLPEAVPMLLVARFVSGLAVGLATPTLTATLSELRLRSTGEVGIATSVSTVANLGGFAVGPIVGGAFGKWSSSPLSAPYIVGLIVLATLTMLLAFIPETVAPRSEKTRYRPQRIVVPHHSRGTFFMAGLGAFAAFAVTGFYGSVAPTFLGEAGGVHDHFAVGLVIATVFIAGAITQVISGIFTAERQVLLGGVAMVAGMTVFAASALCESVPLFVLAALLGGIGVGFLFRSALATAGGLAPKESRGEVLAGVFLLAYFGMMVPPLLVGLALQWLPLTPVLVAFAVANGALTIVASRAMLRSVSGRAS